MNEKKKKVKVITKCDRPRESIWRGEMQTENVAKVVDHLTNNFFLAAGVNYADFQKSRPTVPPNYAHYVHPFHLSEDVRQLKTNLSGLICSPHDPSIKIETLSKGTAAPPIPLIRHTIGIDCVVVFLSFPR